MNNTKVRLRNVDAPANHDGPGINPDDRDKYYANPKIGGQPMAGFWQTFFFAPWHYPRGQGNLTSPSLWTSLFALVLTFISALTYGWVFTTALDQALASGADILNQAFVLGLVSALMFVLTMEWTWEPLLRTHVNFGISFAMIGTSDLGLLPWLVVAAFMMGGFAAAGGIVSALGLASAGPNFVMPTATVNGHWLYWFSGSMIIFSYIFLSKFFPKDEIGLSDNDFDVARRRRNRIRRSTVYAGIAIFAFTMAFRNLGLYYFDAGLYVTGWAATGVSNVAGTGVTDWAFYLFVPLASAATAVLLYYVVQLATYGSDVWDSKIRAKVEFRARYAPEGRKLSVF